MNATIIVLFNPESDVVETIDGISSSQNIVLAVANNISVEIYSALKKLENIEVIFNDQNIGLASALNQGMKRAFELGVDHILFLDQDSKPYSGMEIDLQNEISGVPNAMIGPTLVDVKQKSMTEAVTNNVFENVIGMATSGTFLRAETAKVIGMVKDELFIDGIDHEWCFRAKSKGINLYKSNTIRMIHNMGDRGFSLFGRFKPIHNNPIRHYYIVRNTIYLMGLNYIPLKWKCREMVKIMLRIPFYILSSKKKYETLKMIRNALFDGARKRWGKFE